MVEAQVIYREDILLETPVSVSVSVSVSEPEPLASSQQGSVYMPFTKCSSTYRIDKAGPEPYTLNPRPGGPGFNVSLDQYVVPLVHVVCTNKSDEKKPKSGILNCRTDSSYGLDLIYSPAPEIPLSQRV